ncbi:MAG: cell wall-binding repeat-containing protein [Coriobacteriales bacterium]|jgi:hypothetical protein
MKALSKRAIPAILLSILFATVCLLCFGQRAYADETVTIDTADGFHFANDGRIAGVGCDDGEVFLTGYDGTATDLVIPSTVTWQGETYTVTGILEEALIYSDEDYYAYWLNHDLTSLTLPNTLKYIDRSSISNLGITELTIPESVTLINNHAIGSCPNLKTIRVLSSRTGSKDYYGEDCMGFYWNDDNQSVQNDGLIVWGVCKEAFTDETPDIQDWCWESGVTFKGFPPASPRWEGSVMVWDPPAYRQDAVRYYSLHVYKDGKPLSNPLRTESLPDPTACSYDLTNMFKATGRGTYKFYVTAVCGSSGAASDRSDFSAEYEYDGPVNQYTITFDANGGSGIMVPVTVDVGEPYLMPECTFTPPSGKAFLGWRVRDREYAAGEKYDWSVNNTAKALWRDQDDPGWTYSIAMPDIVLGPAHVGYTNVMTLSEGLFVENTGTRVPRNRDLTIEITEDQDHAFTFVKQGGIYPAAGVNSSVGYFRPQPGLAPGTYTCKVTVTPAPPAQPVTADVSFTVTDHTWENTWQSDTTSHWQKCTQCTKISEKVPHDTNGAVTGAVAATFNNDGYTGDRHCSVCGAVSGQGTPIPAGKYILESSATSNPGYIRAGSTWGGMTLTPGDATRYSVDFYEVYDTTSMDDFNYLTPMAKTTPFVAGHDYTLLISFKAKSPYEYETTGANKHRWSTYTFNGSKTSPYGTVFQSFNVRKIELHCFAESHSISEAEIVISDQEYTGDPIKPDVQVYAEDGGEAMLLEKGRDYKITGYSNNLEVGQASVTIEGVGAFSGQKTQTFEIKPCEVLYPDVESIPDRVFTGSGYVPDPYVRVDGVTLVKNRDYTLMLKNSKGAVVAAAANVDWYEYDVAFKGNYHRASPYASYFAITPASIASAVIADVTDKGFTGKAVTQALTVTVAGRVLKLGADYTVSYANNTNVGTATYTISGKGNYEDSIGGSFKINRIWYRVWGATAPDTMLEIAKEFKSATHAFVTTDASYKDALAASSLAGKYKGIVLMTKKGSLTPQTERALQSARVHTVFIVGSTSEVSTAAQNAIKKVPGVKNVWRVNGKTPSQRAVAVAKKTGKQSDTVIIATQNGFQDALAIAPYSYVSKSPILYAETNKRLSKATKDFIKTAKYKKAIIGGAACIARRRRHGPQGSWCHQDHATRGTQPL